MPSSSSNAPKTAEPNRYTPSHNPSTGPGDARPTAHQIILDNNLTNALPNHVAIVTGASSGIGIPTALALQETGARVFAFVRNIPKAESALGPYLKPGSLELIHMDNTSLSSVRKAAGEFLAKSDRLNILINNAGVMATPEGSRTQDGFELQFGTNHLAHFLLFQLLKPTLLASASREFPSKVVNVSSTGHRKGPGIHFEDLNLEGAGVYTPWVGYAQSKLANILMANELDRRYASQHLRAFSLHPGGIWTGLQDHLPEMDGFRGVKEVEVYMKSPEQGAATSVWAAVGKELEGRGGLYLEDCGVAGPVEEGFGELSPGYVDKAYDEVAEKRLWEVSSKLVGVEE